MQWAYTTCLIFSDSRWRNLKLLRCWEQTGGKGWGRSKSTMCHFTSISSFSLKQTYTSRTLISMLTTETPNVTWKKWHHGCQTVSTECLQCHGDQSQQSGSYFLPMESLGGGRVGSDWEDLYVHVYICINILHRNDLCMIISFNILDLAVLF